jgi:type II secretory ATPase GspE/PulE/Tfp pilus assembly ATPase PilB-like protein
VFSTLHTNDAPSAFTRLIDMKVEPFLVSSTVEGVMAQRLVRTICPECKAPFHPDPNDVPIDFPHRTRVRTSGAEVVLEKVPADAAMMHQLSGIPDGPIELMKGMGCRSCRQSGYRGRTGIHELMVNNDVMRDLVVQRVNAGVIRMEALKSGMITLRQDGWRKVMAGMTSIDEVGRITAGDLS